MYYILLIIYIFAPSCDNIILSVCFFYMIPAVKTVKFGVISSVSVILEVTSIQQIIHVN